MNLTSTLQETIYYANLSFTIKCATASLTPLQNELSLLCLIHPFTTEWSLCASRNKDRVFCFLKQPPHLQQHLLRHKDLKMVLYAKIIIKFEFINRNSILQNNKFTNANQQIQILENTIP